MDIAAARRVTGRTVACFLLACLASVMAAEHAQPEIVAGAAPAGRPRIGLALGGGGARGAAHVGVLRVLDELRVPVDCIAGTSMGALIGGTLAAGMAPAEIERAVLAINWADAVGDVSLRRRTPIRRKLAGITYSNSLEVGVRNGVVLSSGGLLRTQNIEEILRALVAGARPAGHFDDLAIPFRAVATDLAAGEMVILDHGDLAVALRASMAVPGAFAPVVTDGQVLADGGLMRNLPVDVARGLCADVVIAVSLSAPPPRPDDLNGALALAARSLDVIIIANQNAQLASLTERDVSIVVPADDIGSADFGRVPEAIPIGRAAALARRPELARYSLSAEDYRAWRSGVERLPDDVVQLAEVRVTGLRRVNPDFVRGQLAASQPGRAVSRAELAADIRRVHALGDFAKVDYRLSGTPELSVLELYAEEKLWGPDFVRFDLGLAASAGGDFAFALRGEHTRSWLNRRGGEWRNALQVGQVSGVQTSLYQPLDIAQRFFVEPSLLVNRAAEEAYADGDRVATYDMFDGYGQLDAGVNIGTRAALRAGLQFGWSKASLETGNTGFPEVDTTREARLVLDALYDTRNTVALPTDGSYAHLRYTDSGSALGASGSYAMVEGLVATALPFRGDSLLLAVAGGREVNGEIPVYQEFQLGGIRSFPGLERGELRGDSYWLMTTDYNWKLADIQSLFGQSLYAGFRLTTGRMGDRLDGVREGALTGAAVSLLGRSPIGPFVLSLGGVNNDSYQLQLAIGRPIDEGSFLDATH
jgi:NTE family protein